MLHIIQILVSCSLLRYQIYCGFLSGSKAIEYWHITCEQWHRWTVMIVAHTTGDYPPPPAFHGFWSYCTAWSAKSSIRPVKCPPGWWQCYWPDLQMIGLVQIIVFKNLRTMFEAKSSYSRRRVTNVSFRSQFETSKRSAVRAVWASSSWFLMLLSLLHWQWSNLPAGRVRFCSARTAEAERACRSADSLLLLFSALSLRLFWTALSGPNVSRCFVRWS